MDAARATFGEYEFQRLSSLRATDASNGDEVERAKQNLDVAKAQLRADQAALAMDQNGPTATALAQAQARVAEASASVVVTRAAMERRCLRSPVDGVVLYVYMRPGQAIDLESPQPILSLAESGPMRLAPMWTKPISAASSSARESRPPANPSIAPMTEPLSRWSRSWVGETSSPIDPASARTREFAKSSSSCTMPLTSSRLT